jgi:hypothetical protein
MGRQVNAHGALEAWGHATIPPAASYLWEVAWSLESTVPATRTLQSVQLAANTFLSST